MAANIEDSMDTEEGTTRLDVAQKRRLEEDLDLPSTSGSEGEPDGEEWTEAKARKRANLKKKRLLVTYQYNAALLCVFSSRGESLKRKYGIFKAQNKKKCRMRGKDRGLAQYADRSILIEHNIGTNQEGALPGFSLGNY
ncbi:hypothetical protein QE152_g27787 [Popillia japonica]|uniref:Uncharacterized protein n=1 Tax=Popillia japonica TaxID=7064 RepID=A0AAW1JJE0_POPJA